MSGFEVLKRIKNEPSTHHIPVIAVSANAMVRDIKKGKNAGFFDYVTKPIKMDWLLNVIDRALEQAEKNSGVVNNEAANDDPDGNDRQAG